MISEQEFLEQLKDLLDFAKTKESRLTKKEIDEYFSDMKLSDEQLTLVYAYMKEHNVEVKGTENEEEEELTEEDSQYLKMYRREINQLPKRTKEEIESFYERLRQGDETVVQVLIESHLKAVIRIAKKYKNRGVYIEDLIQEGNIALISEVHELLGNAEITNSKKEIERAVRACMIELVDEEMELTGRENSMLAKTNLIYEATKILAEDMGRVANIHELAHYTKMDEKEILELVDLALDEIKLGECNHDHSHHE